MRVDCPPDGKHVEGHTVRITENAKSAEVGFNGRIHGQVYYCACIPASLPKMRICLGKENPVGCNAYVGLRENSPCCFDEGNEIRVQQRLPSQKPDFTDLMEELFQPAHILFMLADIGKARFGYRRIVITAFAVEVAMIRKVRLHIVQFGPAQIIKRSSGCHLDPKRQIPLASL